MATQKLSSRIDTVKIYASGATITRIAQLNLTTEELPTQVEIGELPLALDDSHVTVRVESEQGNAPIASDIRIGLAVPPVGETPNYSPDEELRRAKIEVAKIVDIINLIDREIDVLNQLEVPARPDRDIGVAPPPSPLGARLALANFSDEQIRLRIQEKRDNLEKLAKAKENLADLEKQKAIASTARNAKPEELRKTVTVSLSYENESSDLNQTIQLFIEYFVPGARWTPTYVCRLNSAENKATIAVRALICQRTGEDWSSVRLELCTARPNLWCGIPELPSLRLGKAQQKIRKVGWRKPAVGAEILFEDFDREKKNAATVSIPLVSSLPNLRITVNEEIEEIFSISSQKSLSSQKRLSSQKIDREQIDYLDREQIDDLTPRERKMFLAMKEAQQKAEELAQANEDIQRQVIRLLDDVEGAARGDYTVQAEVTSDMLGALADSFNLVVQQLRDLDAQQKVPNSKPATTMRVGKAFTPASKVAPISTFLGGVDDFDDAPASKVAFDFDDFDDVFYFPHRERIHDFANREIAKLDMYFNKNDSFTYSIMRMSAPEDSTKRGKLLIESRQEAYLETLRQQQQQVLVNFDILVVVKQAQSNAEKCFSLPLPPGGIEVGEASGSFDYFYSADGRIDIPSDGQFHSVALTSKTTDVDVRYVVVPREDTNVFRIAQLRNPLTAPLLSGPADVYIDGEYILSTNIATVPSQGQMELGLGVEQAIKVVRNTSYAEARSRKIILAFNEFRHQIKIEITNYLSRNAKIEVRERFPIPKEGAKIEVQIEQVSPGGEQYQQQERETPIKGGYLWHLEIAAKEQKSLSVDYKIKTFVEHEVVGGNRRE